MCKSWTFFVICTYLGLVQSRKFRTWKELSGSCNFDSYQPGPRNIQIQRTTAQTATLQTTAMQAFFTHVRTGNMQGVNGIGDSTTTFVAALAKNFAHTASKLAPCLGIISGVMGTIIGDLTPTADDIMKITNKAITKLADEVDDRLNEMKTYVDEKVIDLEKDITERKYKFLFSYWSECVKGRSAREVKLCQREAYRLMEASLGEFALFYERLDDNGTFAGIDDNERRRIEINLISFRNYVQLTLMSLKALESTYEHDHDHYGQKMYNMYKHELQTKATFYETYVSASITEIEALNTEYGTTFNSRFHTDSRQTYLYPKISLFGNYYKEYERKCSTILAPIFVPKRCTAHVFVLIRYIGHPLHRTKKTSYTWEEVVGANNDNVAEKYCKQILQQKQNEYREATKTAVKEYWQNEVLKVVTCGKILSTTDATKCV